MDSSAAVSNVKKFGGPIPELVDIVRDLYRLATDNQFHMIPLWIPLSKRSAEPSPTSTYCDYYPPPMGIQKLVASPHGTARS